MRIRLKEDEQIVKLIKQGLSERNGHCPCVREISDDTKCMCRQFRELCRISITISRSYPVDSRSLQIRSRRSI